MNAQLKAKSNGAPSLRPSLSRLVRGFGEPEHRIRWVSLNGTLPDIHGRPLLALVIAGDVVLQAPDHAVTLEPGCVYASDGRTPATLRCELVGQADLLCLWPDAAPRSLPGSDDGARLLPIVHEPGSEIALLLQRLAQSLRHAGTRRLDGAHPAQFWISAVLRAQQVYDAAIERCPGRSAERRRDVFVRLSRARAMLAARDSEAEVTRCAQVARLSNSHFVRLFHHVFGESPHQFRARQRMRRAHQLIVGTRLPVTEVMAQVGYTSLAIFARAFRQHFGVSATALRNQQAAVAMRDEAASVYSEPSEGAVA